MKDSKQHTGPVTVINVLRVGPDKQKEIVRGMEEVCHRCISRQPGFRSAAIYESLDGRRVAIHSQWESQRDFDKAFREKVVGVIREHLDVVQPEWHVYALAYSSVAGSP